MLLCDFCNTEVESTQAHRIHGEPCVIELAGDGVSVGMVSPDDWCACPVCYHRLLAHDYATVARGVTESLSMPSAIAKPLERALVSLYSRLQILQ